jgi:hypothetical protein
MLVISAYKTEHSGKLFENREEAFLEEYCEKANKVIDLLVGLINSFGKADLSTNIPTIEECIAELEEMNDISEYLSK